MRLVTAIASSDCENRPSEDFVDADTAIYPSIVAFVVVAIVLGCGLESRDIAIFSERRISV
jgi:hypothetical protein